MPRGETPVDEEQYNLFVLDGLQKSPSPVFLLVADETVAVQVALALHRGSIERPDLSPGTAGMIEFTAEEVGRLSEAQSVATVRELASAGHWVYLPQVDRQFDVPGGRRFLHAVLDAAAGGELTPVVATVPPERLGRLQRRAVRLMGLAETIDPQRAGEGLERSHVTSVVRHATDRHDVGWTVVVRFDLSAPITPDAPFAADAEMSGAMGLVESLHLVDLPGQPPAGVLVSLIPDAFSMTQEAAALRTAAAAARQLIGRHLGTYESVTPTRAIFYA
jgi:hypothetical protein